MADMDTLRFAKQVAANVKKALDDSGLSILETSQKTGIPRTTLTRRLQSPETSPFDCIELSKIANLTKKTVSGLTRVPKKAIVESSDSSEESTALADEEVTA